MGKLLALLLLYCLLSIVIILNQYIVFVNRQYKMHAKSAHDCLTCNNITVSSNIYK
jgi:hypothetical protein